jgi:hypothetical protein
VNSLFFWIIVLSFLIPVGLRLYRKSVRGRKQDLGMPGGFSNQPDSQYPGQLPGPFPGQFPGNQSKQPRDGYTQQDYFGGGFGGFGQAGGPGQQDQKQPFPEQPYPGQPYQNPPYPGQQYPGQPGYQNPVPYEDSPEYLKHPPLTGQQPSGQAAGEQPPVTPPPPAPQGSAPQGFRARKLAELDQRYSDGELTMEDYMAQRAEIMKG